MTRAEELVASARAWVDGDPDPVTRAELLSLMDRQAFEVLEERLRPLTFGTAGLRGAVGAGPGCMNLAVVLRAAYGIAQHLLESAPPSRAVVIGFDARPTSRAFAEASAGVLLAAGIDVVAFSEAAATPLCAFLGRERAAGLTIVVTASHNPRGDNGYKVYGADAVQITPPLDADIARRIAAAPAARLVLRRPIAFAEPPTPGLTVLDPKELDTYFAAISRSIPAGKSARDLRIVHSALHGVGTTPMLRALSEAGFNRVDVVAAQAEPDGTFPTTPFPNPEEPGTLELALAEARQRDAALLLVNDPDADRLAAAARFDGELTVLDGNQVGALLADYALSLAPAGLAPLVLSSVVSSPLVGMLATARGGVHERTLTGFKWLWSAALELERRGAVRFCFAFEEALGYSVFPAVRDKDGIAAGRALAELAAALAVEGKTLFDRLYELYSVHGLWASAARNITLQASEPASVGARLDALLARQELSLGGVRVVSKVDYRSGDAERPAWLGKALLVELELDGGGRLFARPSGTEPKLKLYAHVPAVITPRGDFKRALATARLAAAELLESLVAELRL